MWGLALADLKFLNYSDIRHVQIDHTTSCNLRCPQCARMDDGELNQKVPKYSLSMADYKTIFPKEFCSGLESVLHCGNYGDAVTSEVLLPSIRYLKENGVKRVSIITNGSLRSKEWWSELGGLLSAPGDKVCFSIDGLKDSNHIYRVNSRFDKIMENAESFIGAGGRARWDYLVFSHNEHEVEEARELAKKMGFFSFNLKLTNRFLNDFHYRNGISESKQAKDSGLSELGKRLSLPEKEIYRAKSSKNFESLIEEYGGWSNYIDQTKINCRFKAENSIFVDFEAKIWPCTWVGAPVYFSDDKNTQKVQLMRVLEKYGPTFNSLRHHSWSEILDHEWFSAKLVESWGCKMNDENQKLMTCGRTCGEKYAFSSSFKENRIEQKLNGYK